MDDVTRKILDSPEFNRLLARRSQLRWGLTTLLAASYVLYGFSGVWFPEAMSRPFLGSSLSWIMAIAYAIMAMAIVSSLWYVYVVGKMHDVRRRGGS